MSKQLAETGRRPVSWMLAGMALLAVAVAATMAALSGPGFAAESAQAQYAPRNTTAPTISGKAEQGQTLTANEGTWTGDQPIVFTFQWLRCNAGGNNCVAIPNAEGKTYTVQAADVDNTLRVRVTATNKAGTSSATSAATGKVVKAGTTQPTGAIRLANGQTSIDVTAVSPPERLIVSNVTFTPNPVRSRTEPFRVTVKVTDTRGFVIRNALVFLRSTPIVTSTPPEQVTQTDGTVTFTVQPRADFPLRNGYNVQFFVRARKNGDNVLAGVSSRRLVQVATAR